MVKLSFGSQFQTIFVHHDREAIVKFMVTRAWAEAPEQGSRKSDRMGASSLDLKRLASLNYLPLLASPQHPKVPRPLKRAQLAREQTSKHRHVEGISDTNQHNQPHSSPHCNPLSYFNSVSFLQCCFAAVHSYNFYFVQILSVQFRMKRGKVSTTT